MEQEGSSSQSYPIKAKFVFYVPEQPDDIEKVKFVKKSPRFKELIDVRLFHRVIGRNIMIKMQTKMLQDNKFDKET